MLKEKKISISILFAFILFALFLVLVLLATKFPHTSKVIYVDTSSKILAGIYELKLKEGELLPLNTTVKVTLEKQGKIKEKSLSLKEWLDASNVSYPIAYGKFYKEGTKLGKGEGEGKAGSESGSESEKGEGVGIAGKIVEKPEIRFRLRVFPSEANATTNETTQPQPTEPTQPTQSKTIQSEITGSVIKVFNPLNFFYFTNALRNLLAFVISEQEIEASINADKPFIYEIPVGYDAEIINDSIAINGKPASIELLKINKETKDNITTITIATDYVVDRGGFGKEFLGKAYSINLSLSTLNFSLDPGDPTLTIELVYNNETLSSETQSFTAEQQLQPLSQTQEVTTSQFTPLELSGFAYKRNITINNTANSDALTDYQVFVTLDTQSLIAAGKMRDDCGDVRFTDTNDNLLSYWLEDGCNTTSTKFWVKVPSIPASSTTTIYLYYGNPSATSLSNGDATFDLFDDFNDATLNTSKWAQQNSAGGTISISNGTINFSVSTSNDYVWIHSVNTLTYPVWQEAKVIAQANNPTYRMGLSTGTTLRSSGNYYPSYSADRNTAGKFRIVGDSASRGWVVASVSTASFNLGIWKFSWISRGLQKASDSVNSLTGSDTTNAINNYYAYFGVSSYSIAKSSVALDWVRIRKYTDPEPSTSVGAEEMQDATPPTIIIISPETTTYTYPSILINISATDDVGISAIWYNWNGTNVTYTEPVYVTFPTGTITLYAYANDTSGNVNSTSVTFNVVGCFCDSCSSCTDALNNASCTEVNLTSDIIDYAGTCIDNPENFTNKTFDCQGHIIKGDDLGADYGIYLNGKTNNTIRNCIITDFAYGILLSSSNYSTITNNTVNNNSYYGIYLSSSSNYSTITNNTVNNNNNIGIYLSSSSNNTITNNTASNNNYGIYLDSSSSYNTITNNTAINNTQWDFYSTSDSLDNTVTNLNISFVISFTSNAIALKSATAPAPDPAGYTDISKYINATNTAAGGWLFLNISYDDAELGDIDESTLRIWKYNGSWYSCSVFASECGVDTVNNVVYANITSFSIFAPLGTPSMICTCDSCSDCMAKLNDPACMEVRLTTEIIDYAGTCIDSPANFINKIFDCQGHIIDGTGSGWAISLDGKNNNTIKNCIISEFGGGIYLVSSRYNNFTNNTIKNNVNYGFYLYSFSDANDIINNTISNNSIGVYIFNPWSNAIINNTIINHTNSGIYLKATQYTSIEGNTITNNNKGIYLEGNSDITMTKNTANNNNYGIYLFDAHRTVSVDTVAIGNGYDLYLAFSDATFNNTITGLNLYFADSGSNFSNLTLNASHGSIVYNNLTIDQYENTVNNINIGYNLISLASENIPNFNRSATLNFYNVTGIVTPIAIRNGVVCGDLCSDVVDLGNNNYQFNVSYFTNYSIGGLPSIPQLYKPAPEAQLYDRTPLFEWFNSTDASSYDLLVANASNFEQASIIINQTGIPEGSGNHSEDWSNLTSYEALVALPVDKILYWKVRACNLYTCSQWSEVRNFTILSSLIVTLVVDNVNFGTMLPNEENDTEDNAPSPLLIQNDGNVIVDIIVTGTDLWQTKPNPSSYYQYKAGINESNSFNETISTMTWTNMSSTNTFVDIADLKYVDESDTAEVELKIKVPPDEPAGSRNSTITITAQSAE